MSCSNIKMSSLKWRPRVTWSRCLHVVKTSSDITKTSSYGRRHTQKHWDVLWQTPIQSICLHVSSRCPQHIKMSCVKKRWHKTSWKCEDMIWKSGLALVKTSFWMSQDICWVSTSVAWHPHVLSQDILKNTSRHHRTSKNLSSQRVLKI